MRSLKYTLLIPVATAAFMLTSINSYATLAVAKGEALTIMLRVPAASMGEVGKQYPSIFKQCAGRGANAKKATPASGPLAGQKTELQSPICIPPKPLTPGMTLTNTAGQSFTIVSAQGKELKVVRK